MCLIAGADVGQRGAQLLAGADPELSEDLGQVPLHRARAEEELGADLRVRFPARSTPSLQGGSHGFAECVAMRRQTSPVPARARQSPNVYPFRTREPLRLRQQRQHYMPICRAFMSKAPDGLEPSTPSL